MPNWSREFGTSVFAARLLKGRAMDKTLCFGSLGVAILMMLIFLLDLIIGVPFAPKVVDPNDGNPFMFVDVLGFLASAIVAYLAFNASKDLR
ncbi:MAG: hypothetical protein C0467_01140 [Planctomycetaceae bacterium]|nr:hypothetical protein [Planctomycetaceae bacterium]